MPTLMNWIFLGLAGGLSLLTKATAFAYLLPFVFWLVITMPGREGLWRALKHMFLAGGIVLALGAGYYTRNTLAYGSPLGPVELLQLHSNQIHTPAVLFSNVVRNLSLHLGTPSQAINDRLKEGIIALHRWLGLDVADPRTTFRGSAYKIPLGPSNREDLAGNPLHLILILVGSLAFALRWRTLNQTGLGWYFLSVLATFLVFSLGNNWQVFGSRLQLSFFVLAAPALGGVVENLWPARIGHVMAGHVMAGHVMALALIVASLPWVLMIQSRPIIPIPGLTYPQSVLVTPRSDLYFANAGDPQFYTFISQKIATAHCDQVGLLLNGDDAEALWWVSLRAMIPTVRLEWLDSDSRLAKLSSLWYFSALDFKPCAALAATQPGRKTLAGLVLWYENDALQLYLGTGK